MTHPHVVDVGNGLQIWRVAVSVPNKYSQTTDKGWATNWGRIGFTIEKTVCYKMLHRASDLDFFK